MKTLSPLFYILVTPDARLFAAAPRGAGDGWSALSTALSRLLHGAKY